MANGSNLDSLRRGPSSQLLVVVAVIERRRALAAAVAVDRLQECCVTFRPMPRRPETHSAGGHLLFAVTDRGIGVVEHEGALTDADGAHFLGFLGELECWAVDGSATDHGIEPDECLPLRALYGRLDEARWAVAGAAVQIVEWDRTHRYCGRCGVPTEAPDPTARPPMRARRCPDCGLFVFPRLAPAVIMLVERDDGRALLAHGAAFPVPMYSCLAGFVEPGEDLESAVKREVKEEVGLEVTDIRYWGSQPWPFPHSLMIGFTARYAGGDIELDPDEIVDAGWYEASDLPVIPPPPSIARRIIDGWIARTTQGRGADTRG